MLSVKKANQTVASAKEYVKQKKEKRITIRLNENDLNIIKNIAAEEGLSYQTFISTILHKVANNRLVDRKIIEEVFFKFNKAA
ncbi:MAG: antitoxin [Oligoflexia bacterium]|nr:antitoxin [Oligoflexia bacterium]